MDHEPANLLDRVFLRAYRGVSYSELARLRLFVLVQLILFTLTAVLLVGTGLGVPVRPEIMVLNLGFYGTLLALVWWGRRLWAEGITALLLPLVFITAVVTDANVVANPLALDLLLVWALFILLLITVTTSRSTWIALAGVMFLGGGLWYRLAIQDPMLSAQERGFSAPLGRYLVLLGLGVLFLITVQRIMRRTNDLQVAVQTLERTQRELVQSEKLAALGRLVAGVSHELNTPIGNALLMASHLREGSNRDAEFSALVGSLEKSAELVKSFKQIAVDRTAERVRRFPLSEAVDDVLFTFGLENKDAPWRIRALIEQLVVLEGDPGALVQILSNLVQNSVLHGFEGRQTGQITLTTTTPRQGWVELSVHDDGRGIPPELVDKIFEPFFTTAMGRGGTGLGLTVCFNLVRVAWGGTLSVESTPGNGTTFRVVIPLVAPPQ